MLHEEPNIQKLKKKREICQVNAISIEMIIFKFGKDIKNSVHVLSLEIFKFMN